MRKGQILGVGRTAEVLAWGSNKALKLYHEGWSSSEVRGEAKIARAVFEAGLPAPAVYGVVTVKGRHGVIFENADGPSMLKELVAAPQQQQRFAQVFASLHAEMHAAKVIELPAQRRKLRAKILKAKPLTASMKKAALKALTRLPDGDLVCHGDFHPDNILMSGRGPVIIDWVDASRGRPEADIARTMLLINEGQPPYSLNLDAERVASLRRRFTASYLEGYGETRRYSGRELEAWRLPVTAARLSEGIKEEEARLLQTLKTLLKES